mgnify:CR=1 FL=1
MIVLTKTVLTSLVFFTVIYWGVYDDFWKQSK